MTLPRILFLDDEPAICSAISRLLAFHSIRVDTVSTGLEARRAIGAGYDALVLDFRIGATESGDEIYRALCAMAPRMTNRTIFVTGDISESVHERIEATGCAMLVKPFEMGILISLIRGTIADAANADAAHAAHAATAKQQGSRSA